MKTSHSFLIYYIKATAPPKGALRYFDQKGMSTERTGYGFKGALRYFDQKGMSTERTGYGF